MVLKKKSVTSRWRNRGPTLALIALSVSSVVFLRAQAARPLDAAWQARADEGLRYVCVGKIAAELGREQTASVPLEFEIELPWKRAAERCRVPGAPAMANSAVLAAASAPGPGYAAELRRVTATKEAALTQASSALEEGGWKETPASVRFRQGKPQVDARSFERPGAWLLAVSLRLEKAEESYLLLAGQYAPALMR